MKVKCHDLDKEKKSVSYGYQHHGRAKEIQLLIQNHKASIRHSLDFVAEA